MTPAEWLLAVGNLFLIAIALTVLIPGLVLFVECAAALLPVRPSAPPTGMARPRVVVLIPAHNEETGIQSTLETLKAQLTAGDRLLVVADNCNDNTAQVARTAGATVIERHDLVHRGKGYALDYGIHFLADDPPDVVIIVDADCLVTPGSVTYLSHLANRYHRPVQALYLFETPAPLSAKSAVSTLAIMVKNWVRLAGLKVLGMPCLLTGTGMALPWDIIRQAPLASGNIVEDMNLGMDLAIAGYSPLFCPEARVTSVLPQKEQAAKSQRTRWEHGHLQTIATQVPRLLKASIQQKRLDLFSLAIDLLVPPLSLLVMVWLVAMVIAIVAAGFGGSFLPLGILSVTGLLIAIAILASWAKFARQVLPATTLFSIPLYILWKIPVYVTFLFKRQQAWVRTERDAHPGSIQPKN